MALTTPQSPAPTKAAPPTAAVPSPPVEPVLVRPLAPSDAVAVNAAVPVIGAGAAARPFTAAGGADALDCLATAVYYEAGSEPSDGQRAVAQVVLNRVRHPAFPNSVCAVVYQGSQRDTGCQFTFTCDGSLARLPAPGAWDRARDIARAALAGAVFAPVGNATHYHANWVVPYWSASLVKSAAVGAHIFYRWSGGWGQPGAFAQPYAGREGNAAALRTAAAAASAGRQPAPALAAAIARDPLLRLVETERKSADGQPRITLRIGSPRRAEVTIRQAPAYVERVEASDNLRWTLEGGAGADAEQPLGGKAGAPAAEPTGGAL